MGLLSREFECIRKRLIELIGKEAIRLEYVADNNVWDWQNKNYKLLKSNVAQIEKDLLLKLKEYAGSLKRVDEDFKFGRISSERLEQVVEKLDTESEEAIFEYLILVYGAVYDCMGPIAAWNLVRESKFESHIMHGRNPYKVL